MAWNKVLNANDTKDMYTLMSSVNSISDNIFFPIILLVIFLISLLGTVVSGRTFARSLTASSFICSILSILMVIMNWLAPTYMYFCFFLTACGLIFVKLSEAYS